MSFSRTICVTGASGFIGTALSAALVARGHRVLACSRRPFAAPGGVQAVIVTQYHDAPLADVLVHLAEPAALPGDAAGPEATATLTALAGRGYRRLVYLSSAAVYGDMESYPRRPDEPARAENGYGRMKRAGEAVALAAGGVAVRLTNVYGPGMNQGTVMTDILAQRAVPGPIRVRDLAPVRDYLWLDDAVSGLVAIAEGSATGVFNLASGEAASVERLALTCLRLWGRQGDGAVAMAPAGRASVLRLDIGETLQHFDWQPHTALDEGLARLAGGGSA
ncbi:MAG: NAD(P)-dependent oxidoreductase [Alphaproteobacteria bacterium]|nr:NAD(P)-dependent oxidoreductase [Alphaproteobacteria bacterium]MBU0797902.1 NAD(P)-dependent oxidoreductase [Alphaproteobacteria bacterium]MBU0886146.1 NAD(P)-dependent oxidoreductase [Alphaproteobacteria bacterium]MBU1812786.1 NAD(P)-dependent oxidoreductase [Alphaproteobacteria bacterium]